jgi:hypothetical protein
MIIIPDIESIILDSLDTKSKVLLGMTCKYFNTKIRPEIILPHLFADYALNNKDSSITLFWDCVFPAKTDNLKQYFENIFENSKKMNFIPRNPIPTIIGTNRPIEIEKLIKIKFIEKQVVQVIPTKVIPTKLVVEDVNHELEEEKYESSSINHESEEEENYEFNWSGSYFGSD